MSPTPEVDRLFGAYVEEHRERGRVDAGIYLEKLDGTERRELAALIDGYLARRPRRSFDPEAFGDSRAHGVVSGLASSLHGNAGVWPIVLPKLRDQAELPDRELVPRLANELGVADKEQKVARYYREMEEGLLPAEGVSDRVLEALARIVGTSPELLRRAGAPVSPEFRSASQGQDASTWDEVDELFLGGGHGPSGG
jgi:hypothetical protein